uniref:Putative atpase inhibitor n=1 Tax=Ixodes ricinus TaxID=34613 RepID=A0A0K8RJI7_IXORI
MALQQGSRAAKSLAKFLPNLSGVRFSGSGEWGSGSGKGGGSGGSIRDAGGTFGKMEAAREVGSTFTRRKVLSERYLGNAKGFPKAVKGLRKRVTLP